jgi:hypothetical protein
MTLSEKNIEQWQRKINEVMSKLDFEMHTIHNRSFHYVIASAQLSSAQYPKVSLSSHSLYFTSAPPPNLRGR